MKKLLYLFIGIMAGLLLGAALVYFLPKPKIITKVTEAGPAEKADLKIQSQTRLTGQAKITPIPTALPVNQDGSQPPKTTPPESPVLALKIDSEIVTQLAGEQKINYYNAEGDLVGSGVHSINAELTTKVLPYGLDFTLEFPDEVGVTIDYKPPETHNRIEVGYDGAVFLNYTYDFKPVFVKYTYDFGKSSGKLGVGLTFEF